MQLDPQKYNKGMISAFRQVVSTEGAGALATGPLTLTLRHHHGPPQKSNSTQLVRGG